MTDLDPGIEFAGSGSGSGSVITFLINPFIPKLDPIGRPVVLRA